METETCKLYSRVFCIFWPNFIKIDPHNFLLYRFKVGAFFETQCTVYRPPHSIAVWRPNYLNQFHAVSSDVLSDELMF